MKKNRRIRMCAVSITLVLCMLLSATSFSVFAQTDGDASATNTSVDGTSANEGVPGNEDASAPEEDNTVDVVMLINNVNAGRKVKKTDVEVRKYKDINLPKNIISDPEKVIGKYAKRALYAGEYVMADQLSDKSLAQSNVGVLTQAIGTSKENFVDVTDYFPADTGEDVTTHIQKLIDTNPGRTLYFPDGEYVISRPITTKGAAAYTVSLWLSDGALIKADKDKWRSSGNLTAMICLGAADAWETGSNDVVSIGSYYSLQGGTIDASGVADGVSIDGGRETLIKNIVIKNTKIGIEIKKGANGAPNAVTGSSDCDFDDITIIGNGKDGSVGMHFNYGYDNTITNIRIYDCQTGIHATTGGCSFRNISVVRTDAATFDYAGSVGIIEDREGNVFSHCYVENYETAYSFWGWLDIVDSCRAVWTKRLGAERAFVIDRGCHVDLWNVRADFSDAGTNVFFKATGGSGGLCSPMLNESLCSDTTYTSYLKDAVIPLS